MAIASTIATVASTAGQLYIAEQRQDAMEARLEARQAAAERQRRLAAVQNAAARRRAVAQRRIQIGAMRNSAAAAGVSGSSGAIGGQVSLLADAIGDLSTNNQVLGLNRERLNFLSRAAEAGASASEWATRGQMVRAVGSLASRAFGSMDFSNPATTSTTANTPSFRSRSTPGQSFALPPRGSISAQRIG